jgi:predicted amidohydrolase
MSQKIIIAAAQLGPSAFRNGRVDKAENAKRILALLNEAVQKKVKIICFSELAFTPYFPAHWDWDFDQCFDQIPNELTQDIFSLTQQHPVSVLLPYGEFDGVAYYNTVGVIHDGQLIGKYRKIHIPSSFASKDKASEGPSNYEKQYFTPGNLGYPVFELHGVKVGIQICYDRFFPEGFRILALKGAQLIFNPNALPIIGIGWRVTTWEPLLQVRAFENNVFLVGINKAGDEKGLSFSGDSMILNAHGGSVIARSQTLDDELVVAEIDIDDIIEAKKSVPIFRDRRPVQYGLIADTNSQTTK